MTLDRRQLLKAGLASGALAAAPALPAKYTSQPLDTKTSPRREVLLDSGWRFHLGHAADLTRDFGFGRDQRTFAKAGAKTADAAMPDFNDGEWAPVRVPHDWAVDLPYAPPKVAASKDTEDAVAAHGFKAIGRDYPENSIGWYRRPLEIRAEDKDRAVWLEFDGVFRDCIVFVNGYVVGGDASGYTPFRVDIGDFLDYSGGQNLLAVRADATLGEGWFYEGAGIYRHVRLISAAAVHVPQWGVFVRSEVDGDGAAISVSTDVANTAAGTVDVKLWHRVIAPDGVEVATTDPVSARLAAEESRSFRSTGRIRTPLLWSVETPNLYRLITEVTARGVVVDRVETPFGVRTLNFDASRGFFLNGKNVKLLGTCNHQDHAGVGTAIPDALHAWRVEQLKAMGSNAWRSAHNPPSQALLDICDNAGMLMIVEARLNSTSPQALDELDRMVRSSRNHPSVILWSIGNEEPHQGTERGARISREMVARVKALDPTRLTTQAFDNSFDAGASRVVDVIGFNYRIDQIEAFHRRFPDQPIIGSETGSTVATRGEYRNDAARHVVRAYDTEHPWWASTAEEWWSIAADRPYIAGGFIWTGFDYRGEPTPFPQWPSKSSYFGVLDQCGFPKDNYYYYRSWWRPDQPIVHLLPHWNWEGEEGQPIEVWAYSNCAEVELIVNGRSVGRKPMPRNGHLAWQVPFAAGKIEARGYDHGVVTARDRRDTAGPPHAIVLTSDRSRIRAVGNDVAIVTARIVDRSGRLVPTADVPLELEVSGAGRLIGSGNGNPVAERSDRSAGERSFNGLGQLLVQSTRSVGPITITARAQDLRAARLLVSATGEA
jgi:beta-galactosidase